MAAAETLRQTLGAEALETEAIGAVEAPAFVPEPDEAEPSARGSARGLPSQEEPSARGSARGLPSQEKPRRGIWGRVTGLLKRDEPAPTDRAPAPPATATDTVDADDSAPAITEVAITRTTVDRTVLDVPEHFFGEVTAHRKLVRDRQLIAVDDRALFEGDVWRESKIRPGHRVEVQKVSSLFGERYRIIGPSKRAVTANRIRCERVELNTDDRRKCALLPDD